MLKELLSLYKKHVHFKCNGEIYIQRDGAAMELPLGPLLANVFIISLEETMLAKLRSCLCNWRRYADDIFIYAIPKKLI